MSWELWIDCIPLFFSSHVWEPADWEEGYIHDTVLSSSPLCLRVNQFVLTLSVWSLVNCHILNEFEVVYEKGPICIKHAYILFILYGLRLTIRLDPPIPDWLFCPNFQYTIVVACCSLSATIKWRKNATFQHFLWSSAFGVYKSGMQRRNHLRLDSYF